MFEIRDHIVAESTYTTMIHSINKGVGFVLFILLGVSQAISQNIGIGTENPEGILHISKDHSLVGPIFNGTGLDDILVVFDPDLAPSSIEISWSIKINNSGWL